MKSVLHICLLWMILHFSCTNPFNIREPEEPLEKSDIYEQPTTYQAVLKNLRFAIIQSSIDNYTKCFVDPDEENTYKYQFLPDRRIDAGFFNDWDIESEIDYITSISIDNKIKSINLKDFGLIDDDYKPITSSRDSVQTSFFDYELTITATDSVYTYIGQSKLKLVQDANSLWSIYYWEDIPSKDNLLNTWSVLKLSYH